MSTEIPPAVEPVFVAQPVIVRREVESASNTGWWIATIVGVIAVMALIFVFTSQPNTTDLETAQEVGRNQAMVDNAAAQARSSADAAANLATVNAAVSAANASQSAAETGRMNAERRAQAAEDVATAAKAKMDAEPPTPSTY